MTTDDALWEAARSGDRAAALALADAIGDEDLAYAVRWCGAKGKWPCDRREFIAVNLTYPWAWFRQGRIAIAQDAARWRKAHPAAALPGMVYAIHIKREGKGLQTWDGWTAFRKELDALSWLARRLRVGRDVFEASR